MVTATAITRKIPKTICWAKTETAPAAAPKGRPRDAEQTRERNLEAATVEFARKGLGGARVDAIALRSKSNKRMIYHYSGSKEQLFKHVIETAYVGIRAVSGQFMQMVKQILDRGVSRGKKEHKMGQRASQVGQLHFDSVALGPEALLGPLNRGFHIMMSVLDKGRIGIGALAVGIAQAG